MSSCQVQENDKWITLNVGGQQFLTSRTTLFAADADSMLARMFDQNGPDATWKNQQDSSGAYVIDRTPKYFEPVLNFLRTGRIIVDVGVNLEGVLEEAKYFGISGMVSDLEHMINENKPAGDHSPFTRRQVADIIARSYSNINKKDHELRFQGLNFSGADLSFLDLSHVNFKHANLSGANLSGCTLSFSNFIRANLSHAKLDGAELLGVRMACATLEHASLKGCNFEDPTGTRAVLEGANLKYAVLEGSQMSGVNLRVATLKNANVKNCSLRSACLAGADLENCDLSGSDLHEANLRGANFQGALFELMVNPLHMSQAI